MIGLAGSVVFYAMFGVATSMMSIAWLFVARVGAGVAGATIATAQAYIADSTSQQNRTKGRLKQLAALDIAVHQIKSCLPEP